MKAMKQTHIILIAIAFLTIAKGLSAAEAVPDTTIKPAAYWTMDQISDGVLRDQIGLHHAKVPGLIGKKDQKTGETLPDFTPTTESGIKGNAVAFDQKQQGFLAVTAPEKFNFKDGLTVSAWVKVKNANAQMVIISCAEDIPIPKGGWCLTFSYGNVSFKAVDATGAPVSVASPKNSVAANHWFHIAAVADNTAIRLYLNGVEAGSKPFAGPVKIADTALVIGNHATIAGWRHGECPAFGGLLDEVKIFEKPLTAADVKAESEQVLPQQ